METAIARSHEEAYKISLLNSAPDKETGFEVQLEKSVSLEW